MKRLRKSNRVSWATGVNLCQVKLFLSDDYPSKVGHKLQDHLQAKASSMLHSSMSEPNDLPPGFESSHFRNQSKVELSCIAQTKWECPAPFVVSSHWRVAAGEESREKEDQKLREMRVLEAVYPRLSAIPPSPTVSLNVEEEDYDDNITPLIPIIPIEEEESMDILPEFSVEVNPSPNVQLQNSQQYMSATNSISSASNASHKVSLDTCLKPLAGESSGLEADIVAASSVVATIMSSNEQGRLIDMDLLVKIFNDPKVIEKLINEHTTATTTLSASSNTVDIPSSGVKPAIPSALLSTSTPDVIASRATHSSTGVFLPSGLKPANPSISLLNPTLDKPATLSVAAIPPISLLSSTHEKLVTASVPLSRPVSGKPVTPPVSMFTPSPAPNMHRSISKNFHHVTSGMSPALNTQSQQDTALASGPKRAASVASISSSELNPGPLPSTTGNLHAVGNQVQSAASTVPYKLSTGSAFAVKDANYYKNLIRQHGADRQDMQDSHIGIRHSKFQDMKPVHNLKQGEVNHKIQKPCIYFKSSRGCRNGSNCPYLHDIPAQWGAGNVLGAQSAKRLKLGSEI
ncbi:zinc finger CCCH domain-containing protein 6 [Cajanus cajan]|uniref:zinc finger CCCH domain-containing protein 6 n=1 Tax=Cajanus cajan TaxID=3821 RepID=UPI00098D7783|nr:zinc finger CCCH domain-containing protein 6 [Cajanus cajan]XP_020202718.1 zinc finger CCCH domain-containing protein 6 [Cajanus cajan]